MSDTHATHETFEADCPQCERERAKAIAQRDQIRQSYRVDYSPAVKAVQQ